MWTLQVLSKILPEENVKKIHFIFSLPPLESGLWEVVAKFVSNHDSQLYPRTVTTIFSKRFIPNVEQNKAFTRSVKSE